MVEAEAVTTATALCELVSSWERGDLCVKVRKLSCRCGLYDTVKEEPPDEVQWTAIKARQGKACKVVESAREFLLKEKSETVGGPPLHEQEVLCELEVLMVNNLGRSKIVLV